MRAQGLRDSPNIIVDFFGFVYIKTELYANCCKSVVFRITFLLIKNTD